MFLSMLENEKKELFLDLAIHAVNANKNIAEEQKAVIAQYCSEMDMQNIRMETSKDLETVLEELLKVCTEGEKRIITFEALGLLLSDNTYDDMEKAFFQKITRKFGFRDALAEEMLVLLNDYNQVLDRICKAVL